jgi:hypothetical protein
MSVEPSPAMTRLVPQIGVASSVQINPAPVKVAVIDSAAAEPAAFLVTTRIVAWVVVAAVATTATAESDAVVYDPALMYAVVEAGVTVVEAVAAVGTTMLTSLMMVCTGIVELPFSYVLTITV